MTPPAWAAGVLGAPQALLADHAHLERKAASNALDLLSRWPVPTQIDGSHAHAEAAGVWTRTLTRIARDESQHLVQVLDLLHARGGAMTRHHENAYAAALHRHVRRGQGLDDLMDRLLVAALIECRSVERFCLLAAKADDGALTRLYGGLEASERGHHASFLRLALLLPGLAPEGVGSRYATLLDAEAEIMAAAPPGPGIHSGID